MTHYCQICHAHRCYVYLRTETDRRGVVWEVYQCPVCRHVRKFAVA